MKKTGIDWIDRIIDEREETYNRLVKLNDFKQTDKFNNLTDFEKSLLNTQAYFMEQYIYVLDRRIMFYVKG